MNGTHNSERFDCSMCGTQFKHKKTLESHFKTVHGKVNFKHINCPHCEYKSSRNEHMQMHIDAVHLGLRPFKCDVCDKDFTQKTHLRTHQKNVHENVQDTRFKCDECSKFYQSNQQLREHTERVHLKMKLQNRKCPFFLLWADWQTAYYEWSNICATIITKLVQNSKCSSSWRL